MKFGTSFVYLRDAKRFPVACLALHTTPESVNVHVGVATYNPHDTFNRARARQISAGRMNKKPLIVPMPQGNLSHKAVVDAAIAAIRANAPMLTPRLKDAVESYIARQ